MPFPYGYICDLLQQLDDEVRKSPDKQTAPDIIIKSWFEHHRSLINAPENGASAILSTLLPEMRTDRVYNIQAPRLQKIFAKALRLGASRVLELQRWTESGSGVDLADCIETILRRTPNSRDDITRLTVEEIDDKLLRVAAACRYSSPAIRAPYKSSGRCELDALLAKIYTQLGSRDAKWFTRLILKNYQPAVLKPSVVLANYHPLLPQIMEIRDDFSIAIECIRHLGEDAGGPDAIIKILKPCLGTKVGRQPWFKGRSIKHCLDMVQGRDIACEQKMDGEYCQIHIDLRKSPNYIQIFSKSGKDSTMDRVRLHETIRDSLNIGKKDCPFKTGCILEGELLVYSDKEERILPFHKIRKHVSRSGSFLGAENDSQAHDYEHLMIVYFDVLLIDEESLLGMKNSERFQRLSRLVTSRIGYAELVARTTICTSQPSAASDLRELFAQCISSRGEGLVLKPDEPYISLVLERKLYKSCNIKLKKEYIQGWGDIGDFAVIGASYDAAKAKEYMIPNVKWTHFFIGCLENTAQARAKTEMPLFRVTNIVELTGPVLSAFWDQGSPVTVPYEDNTSILLTLSERMPIKPPTVVFPSPLVFDMRCFSFDKEPNTNFWSMRFPQVGKVHYDRSYLDTISFSKLQEIAEETMRVSADDDSQETRRWIKALERIDRGGPSQATSSIPSTSSLTERRNQLDSPTPAGSSTVEGVGAVATPEEIKLIPTTTASRYLKRSATEDLGLMLSQKRSRKDSDTSLTTSSQNMSSNITFSLTRHREPLGEVDSNVLETSRTGSELSSSVLPRSISSVQDEAIIIDEKTDSSPQVTQSTTSVMGSPPPRETARVRQSSATTADKLKADEEESCCSIAGDACTLANYSVLLSPCVAGYAHITDDLLGRHGIVPLLDLQAWDTKALNASLCDGTENRSVASSPQATPASKRQTRKICLVDPKQKQATEAFLGKIKDADIRRKDGKREWVTVYDWRVLESITEHESKAASSSSSRSIDPWRWFYMGIV